MVKTWNLTRLRALSMFSLIQNQFPDPYLFVHHLVSLILRRRKDAEVNQRRIEEEDNYPKWASRLAALATMFANAKDRAVFQDRHDFEFDEITAVIDSCTTATVLNNKHTFSGKLKDTSDFGIITLGRMDHKPTHVGTVKILIKDDEGKTHSM